MFGNLSSLLGAGQRATQYVCGLNADSLKPYNGLFGFGYAFFGQGTGMLIPRSGVRRFGNSMSKEKALPSGS